MTGGYCYGYCYANFLCVWPARRNDVCVYAEYKQQRDCYGSAAVTDAGFECFSAYNDRLTEISRQGAAASTRAVAVSICRYAYYQLQMSANRESRFLSYALPSVINYSVLFPLVFPISLPLLVPHNSSLIINTLR